MFLANHVTRGAKYFPGKQRARVKSVIEVEERTTLSDGKRSVEVYAIENRHAAGMLIGYIPDSKLGFVTDIWSPGRDQLGEKLTPGQADLVKAVKKFGLAPVRFAGGHGASAEFGELAAKAQ